MLIITVSTFLHIFSAIKIANLSVTEKFLIIVYDLTVENEHCFYANGILVGNCHDAPQYLCTRIPMVDVSKDRKKMLRQIQQKHGRRPVYGQHGRHVNRKKARVYT